MDTIPIIKYFNFNMSLWGAFIEFQLNITERKPTIIKAMRNLAEGWFSITFISFFLTRKKIGIIRSKCERPIKLIETYSPKHPKIMEKYTNWKIKLGVCLWLSMDTRLYKYLKIGKRLKVFLKTWILQYTIFLIFFLVMWKNFLIITFDKLRLNPSRYFRTWRGWA